MEIFKNKLFLACLIAVAILALSFWLRDKQRQVDQTATIDWIINSHAQQFCSAIYPRIAHCVTFETPDCEEIAVEQISICIDESDQEIPEAMTPMEARKIFNSYTECFANSMHDEIVEYYAVESDECAKILS